MRWLRRFKGMEGETLDGVETAVHYSIIQYLLGIAAQM
jgi:hypothetical protein